MNLNDILLEADGKELVIIYPGRFHPFHIGHGKVYKYLKQNYSNAKVFIATSGKVDGDRSPFTFDEKRKMMILAGVDASAIVQTKSPYQSIEIMERFDKDTTVVVFAVSEKDMAEDPRFDFSNGLKLKKNGEPAYLQKWNNLNDAETFGTHGYIATTPTFPFEVLGQKINSASQIRNMISQSDDTKLTQLLQDLYSVTDVPQDVIELFKNKIGNTETMNENWDEHSFSEYLKENVIEDNIMKDSILKALTEGKSPHKKGTKKYKAHMAAMHAESFDEEFDRKVKEVLEAKTNETDGNDQQSKLEYIHMALSASKDGDLTFDEMTAGQALEYVKEIKVEREEDKKKLSYISTTLSASIDEDSYFDEQMADQALEYVEDIIERPLDEETVKEGGYHNEQHEQLEYIHHVLQECGDGNMDITMIEQALEYVEEIREQHFDDEGNTKSESVSEDWEDVTPKGYGPDDYDEKDVAPEHNGELDKMQDLYKHNEDRNNHSGNIEMLAQAFGNRDEVKAIEGLLKIIKRQGYTTPEQSDMMYKAIHKKYYSQLFPETETEGNKFSGELKKAKIDGKKSFDVDGKTYKVKEALSKLLDKQKI